MAAGTDTQQNAEGHSARTRIEALLAGLFRSERPTHTVCWSGQFNSVGGGGGEGVRPWSQLLPLLPDLDKRTALRLWKVGRVDERVDGLRELVKAHTGVEWPIARVDGHCPVIAVAA